MPGPPIGHHTVPRFYLTRFAHGKRLRAVNIRTRKTFGSNVDDATTVNHFYRLEDHAEPHLFERELGQFETAASPLITAMINGEWPLTAQDREVFSEYLALQFLRGPDHRQQLHTFVAGVLAGLQSEGQLDTVTQLKGVPPALDGSEPLISPNVHAQQIANLIPRLVPSFLSHSWNLVHFDEPSLITSDAPLTPVADPSLGEVGLGIDNALALLFPLSRHDGLLMGSLRHLALLPGAVEQAIKGNLDFKTVGDEAHRDLFNTHTVMHAHEHVYYHPNDAHLVPDNLDALARLGGRIDLSDLPPGLLPAP